MAETYENWRCRVNNCVYNAHQTREIYQVLPYSVWFKAPGPFEIHRVNKHLENVVIWNKGTVNILNDRNTRKQLVRETCK